MTYINTNYFIIKMKPKFTPSQIGLIKDCKKCFWLEHNKHFKRPRGIYPSLPSGMDKILKEHFDVFMKKGELPPEIKDMAEFKGAKLFDDENLLNKWRNNRVGIKYETDDFILKGAIDALLIRNKKFIILDYKTRGYPLKADTYRYYIDQQALYNFLFRKNGYDTEDYSYLLFYHPDKVVGNVFLFHKDLVKIRTDVKKAEELIKKALKLISGKMPEADPSCEYCRYRETKINVDKKEKKTSLLDF